MPLGMLPYRLPPWKASRGEMSNHYFVDDRGQHADCDCATTEASAAYASTPGDGEEAPSLGC